MTKSTITRERLAKIKSWRETYGAGSNVMLPAEEAEELARIALAAMNGEPFAYIIQDKYERERGVEGHLSRSHVSKYVSQEDINEHEITCIPLYRHAQPVPVVEREPIAWLNDAYLARGVIDGEAGSEDAGPGYIPVYREAGPQPATVVPDAATAIRACLSEFPESARDIVEECADIAENACRAAMLAAAPQSPGSEPATVPGEWIPVSEQMPPSRHEVLVGRWWGEKPRWCCKWATYIPGHPDAQSSGWLIPGASWTPTHWMPLPAAPQEPKP